MNDGPKLTKKMTMHLNGGRNYSQLHYEIYADGEPTGITWHDSTNGSPEYRYTAREIRDGDVVLDLMADKATNVSQWIRDRLAARKPAAT